MLANELVARAELGAGGQLDARGQPSRGEVRAFYAGSLAGNDAIWLPVLERKITAVHVHLTDGTLVEDAPTLVARLDDMDTRLVRWLVAGVMAALQELLQLGKASKRLLFAGVEVAAPKKTTTPATS